MAASAAGARGGADSGAGGGALGGATIGGAGGGGRGALSGGQGVMEKALGKAREIGRMEFGAGDAMRALAADSPSLRDFGALLSPAAGGLLEEMARRAKAETERRFGNSVGLFTPLYLANFCDNACTYCAFSRGSGIARGKLALGEIEREMEAIAETGLREILLLTGDSRSESGVDYIGSAVELSKKYFAATGIEVYPLAAGEYAQLSRLGADFANVYQETYDAKLYAKCHPSGPKSDFAWRFGAPERALEGGMRGVSLGALLGLGDFRSDAFAAGAHAYYLSQKYPDAEISLSVPRLRGDGGGGAGERQLLQAMLAYRIFMPFASIAISTRERAGFRDGAIGLAANKISAGVKVSVGGRGARKKGGEQFEIRDERSVSQVHAAIAAKGLQPVYSDHIRLTGGA